MPSDIAARNYIEMDRPIGSITVQLPSKTSRFFVEFRELSRVRSTESSGFMERAMGTEPMADFWGDLGAF